MANHPALVTINQVLRHTSPSLGFNLYGTRMNAIRIVAKVKTVRPIMENISAIKMYDLDSDKNLDVIFIKKNSPKDRTTDKLVDYRRNLIRVADHDIYADTSVESIEDADEPGITTRSPAFALTEGTHMSNIMKGQADSSEDIRDDSASDDDMDSQGQYLYCATNYDLREWDPNDVEANFVARSQPLTDLGLDRGPVSQESGQTEEADAIGAQRIERDLPRGAFGGWSLCLDENACSDSHRDGEGSLTGSESSDQATIKSRRVLEGDFVRCTGVALNLDGKVMFFANSLVKIKV